MVASFQAANWESASFLRFTTENNAKDEGDEDNNDDDPDDYDAYVNRQQRKAAAAGGGGAPAVDSNMNSVVDSLATARFAKRGKPLHWCEGFHCHCGIGAAAAPAVALPVDPNALFIGGDGFVRPPSDEAAALLLSFPQSVFDHIVLGLSPRPLRLVCRRWLSMFRSLRVHWLADSADTAIEAQLPRLEALVVLDLSHTNVSLVGLNTITRCASSLTFLNLAHCICLTDAAGTCDALAKVTRLRQIDLTGIALAPPHDAIVALASITRLQRLTWHDGVREFATSSLTPLPSLDAVKELLGACTSLRIQFKTSMPVVPSAVGAAVVATESRLSFVKPDAVKVLQRWPSCGVCSRLCFKTRTDAETRELLKCDICNALAVGADHLVCMQHTPKIVHCRLCHDASTD